MKFLFTERCGIADPVLLRFEKRGLAQDFVIATMLLGFG
jgi:hypothetical protein